MAILVITMLIHLLILQWAQNELTLSLFAKPDPAWIDIEPEPVTSINLLHSSAERKPQNKKSPVSPAKPAKVADVSQPDPATDSAHTASTETTNTDAPSASHDTTQKQSEEQAPEQITAKTETQGQDISAPIAGTSIFDKISLPPPAQLNYTVTASRDGSKVEGRGTINWQPNGEQYAITGDASIIFLTVLTYKSTGSVDQAGIMPELYVEKRLGKSETNTHFHRERKTISFSASTNSYPTTGGEQDRASAIWQIAAMGRGDGEKFAPGLNFGILIAGTRSAAIWRVVVNGKESIQVAGNILEAWHLTIMPAEQSQELQFELWLSPQKEWYPVKLLYSDKKNGYLELVLNKLEQKISSAR